MVEACLEELINNSGDINWKILITHLSNVQYNPLEEGQCLLHVGWVGQAENEVGTEGCNYPMLYSSSLAQLHTIHRD